MFNSINALEGGRGELTPWSCCSSRSPTVLLTWNPHRFLRLHSLVCGAEPMQKFGFNSSLIRAYLKTI